MAKTPTFLTIDKTKPFTASLNDEVNLTLAQQANNVTDLVKLSFQQFKEELDDIQDSLDRGLFRLAEMKLEALRGVVEHCIKELENGAELH